MNNTPTKCPSCDSITISGVYTHEHGCPDAWKDTIPECMSEVVGEWILCIQDAMPADIRNSKKWRSLLPLAAGTGRGRESERLDIVMEWLWSIVLPQLLPLAAEQGFGVEWQRMLDARTSDAANVACVASTAAANVASTYASTSAYAAATASFATAASFAARSATASSFIDSTQYWSAVDPCGLLEKLITLPRKSPMRNLA